MSRRLTWKIGGLLSLLLVLTYVSLNVGATGVLGFSEILRQLEQPRSVVGLFRLPRTLAAILVGACFAISGSMLQSLTRNPLASPDLIGVTSGGALATVLVILVGGSGSGAYLSLVAFAGAAAMAGLVWTLGKDVSGQRFVLTGVALTAVTQAVITLLLVTYAPSAAEAMIWLKGSLFGRGWNHVNSLVPWATIALLGGILSAHQANPLALGSSIATSLGVQVLMMRRVLWVLSVAAAAGAVSVAGTIGFVGLLVPHAARKLAGSDLRACLPTSALLGATMVLLADTIGRVLAPPLEIPAGLLCALLGAPYFGFLLWKGKSTL